MAAALPLATAAVGAFGQPAGQAQAAPPGGGGPAAFRSAGINVGSKVVGGGKASTDGQSSAETQAASQGNAADPLGYVSNGAGAWYSRPGVILGLVGAFLALGVAAFLLLRRPKRGTKK